MGKGQVLGLGNGLLQSGILTDFDRHVGQLQVSKNHRRNIGAVLDLSNKADLEAIRAGDMTYDYTIPILMLVVCGFISIFLAYKLKAADRKQKFGLELPSGQTPE